MTTKESVKLAMIAAFFATWALFDPQFELLSWIAVIFILAAIGHFIYVITIRSDKP